jgi:hypothetical protein
MIRFKINQGGHMKIFTKFFAFILMIMLFGCSTSIKMKLPSDTKIVIGDKIVSAGDKDTNGFSEYKTRPFFWTSVAGIDYSLMQGDKVLKQGKLPARFRVVSIFFPPYGFIYWPVGFAEDSFDFTKDALGESLPSGNMEKEAVLPAVNPEKQDAKQNETKK